MFQIATRTIRAARPAATSTWRTSPCFRATFHASAATRTLFSGKPKNPNPAERKQASPPQSPPPSSAPPTHAVATPGPTEADFQTHPILKRIPKFLRSYASKFINAPFSHLISFLILHELTAIIPLFGIWYYLHHHPGIVPLDLPQWALSKGSKVLDSLLEQFQWNFNTSDKIVLMMEGAYAFTIVKLLLPVRVVISLWGMPLFARWFVLPITNLLHNLRQIKRIKRENAQLAKKREPKQVDKPRL
ncbi:uncharacterized protein LODBEIA_P43650 [Lodderomyces beijingensis]|uniref:DUF1279 domain-containing protein n=1 Tax=Lodderomyces beijingensis TaxID=1775926 RepID=A0ABP0ZT51_9ASCO